MRIRVLLFGPAARAAGNSWFTVELDRSPTGPQLIEALADQCPALAPYAKFGRLAVNSSYHCGEAPIRETDEVALISMVSGG